MFSPLELALLLLAAAVAGVVLFRMMHLPPMLGYLVVGILIGPHGFGMAQVLVTLIVTMAFGWVLAYALPNIADISWKAAFALGGALAMSSTAIVSKLLTERLELESEHGRRIMGILLFQDFALVAAVLLLIPGLPC